MDWPACYGSRHSTHFSDSPGVFPGHNHWVMGAGDPAMAAEREIDRSDQNAGQAAHLLAGILDLDVPGWCTPVQDNLAPWHTLASNSSSQVSAMRSMASPS